MTSQEFDQVVSEYLDSSVLGRSVRDVATFMKAPLIRARRSLTRLHKAGAIFARKVPASKHDSRGPRPLKYCLKAAWGFGTSEGLNERE